MIILSRVFCLAQVGVFSLAMSLLLAAVTCAAEPRLPAQKSIEKNRWQLGIALGLGVKTNPLVGGDNVPLLVLPDIAWYGERFYFDNTELGYQWHDSKKFTLQSYFNVDKESAYFKFAHPANIVLPLETGVSNTPNSPPDDFRLSIKSLGDRRWAFHGGIRATWYAGQQRWSIAAEQDVSGTHKGQKWMAGYAHNWQFEQTRISLTTRLTWFSRRITHYYYGIDERDLSNSDFYYQAKAGWQPSVQLQITHPINDQWQWLTYLKYQHLHSGMKNSPVVDKNNVTSVFSGLAYRF